MESKKHRISIYRVQMVKEGSVTVYNDLTIRSPKDAEQAFRALIGDYDREVFAVAFLNTKNKITGLERISIGSLNASIVHPREVFKSAILHNACSIIVCHNHPSGDDSPSHEDINVTERLVNVGKILGIDVLDSIILGENKIYSLREAGLM